MILVMRRRNCTEHQGPEALGKLYVLTRAFIRSCQLHILEFPQKMGNVLRKKYAAAWGRRERETSVCIDAGDLTQRRAAEGFAKKIGSEGSNELP